MSNIPQYPPPHNSWFLIRNSPPMDEAGIPPGERHPPQSVYSFTRNHWLGIHNCGQSVHKIAQIFHKSATLDGKNIVLGKNDLCRGSKYCSDKVSVTT